MGAPNLSGTEVGTKSKRKFLTSRNSYWVKLLEEFEQSGLAQKQFAQLHGIKSTTLSKWKYILKKSKKKSSEKTSMGKIRPSVIPSESINFLPLELSESFQCEEKALVDKILFHHKSGFTLELQEKSNKALFRSGLLMLLELSRC